MADDQEREGAGQAANLSTTGATPPREGVPADPREMRDPEATGVAGGLRPNDPAAAAAADRTALEDVELSEAEEDVAPDGLETAGPSGTTPVGPAEG